MVSRRSTYDRSTPGHVLRFPPSSLAETPQLLHHTIFCFVPRLRWGGKEAQRCIAKCPIVLRFRPELGPTTPFAVGQPAQCPSGMPQNLPMVHVGGIGYRAMRSSQG